MIDDGELVAGSRGLLEKTGIAPGAADARGRPVRPGRRLRARRAPSSVHLRELGVRLSLDDLGRASSVAAIRTLPLHQVKIDAMFLHEAGRGGRADAIVRSLVGLAYGARARDRRRGRREQARLGGARSARLRSRTGLLPRPPDAAPTSSATGSRRAGPSSPSRADRLRRGARRRAAAIGTTAQTGSTRRRTSSPSANAASPTPSIDVVSTGFQSAAASTPDDRGADARRARPAPTRASGSTTTAAARRRAAETTAGRSRRAAIAAPATPFGVGSWIAPRYAENVKSGPGIACASP